MMTNKDIAICLALGVTLPVLVFVSELLLWIEQH